MKRLFQGIILPVLLLTYQVTWAQHTISDLVGRWESTDGTTGYIEFVGGQKVMVAISGLQIPTTPYTVDFSKDPIWFDVYITTSRTVKGLLQFMDANTIKWQIFLNGDRTLAFSEGNNPVVILKRRK